MSVEDQSITFTPSTTDETSEASISTETLGDVFASTRRRTVLKYLRTRDSAVELDELAEAVAAREFDTDRDDVSEDRYERVLVSLHHTHLPKLAEAGILTLDRTSGIYVTGNDEVLEVLA